MKKAVLNLTRKWWLYLIIGIMNFTIPPIATSNFKLEEWGEIISNTLMNAFSISSWKPISIPFQLVFIAMVLAILFVKKKPIVGKVFALFVALCYVLFAIGQNIAITNKYGLSIVSINVIMFLFVSYSWIVEFMEQKNEYNFKNWNVKYLWMIIFSIIAFWHPVDYTGVPTIELNLEYFLTGGAAMAFCLTTPLFLTIMTLNIPKINLLTYRISALFGTIIGIYNMLFFSVPEMFWIAIVHIPLMTVSLYCLVKSYKIEKRYKMQ